MPEEAIRQGEVWWVELEEPFGSESGFDRPHVVVQSNALNDSRLGTIVACPVTSRPQAAAVPGNVTVSARETGLERPSTIVVALVGALDRRRFTRRLGQITPTELRAVIGGIGLVLQIEG